jgi:hypothetical protein
MSTLKRRLLHYSQTKTLSWLRFIDDIEMKWVYGRKSFSDFICMANSFQYSIKFTVEISTSKIRGFFYTIATLTNGEIEFSIHTKPTDSHLHPMPSSCHPPHSFKGMLKGLATRIRRICFSSTRASRNKGISLKTYLTNKGYDPCKVQIVIDEMARLDRQSLLQYKERS